jgi:hypothetical protein
MMPTYEAPAAATLATPPAPNSGAQIAANRLLAATTNRGAAAQNAAGQAQQTFETGWYARTQVSPRLTAYMNIHHATIRGSSEEHPLRAGESHQPHVATNVDWDNRDTRLVRFQGSAHDEKFSQSGKDTPDTWTSSLDPQSVARAATTGASGDAQLSNIQNRLQGLQQAASQLQQIRATIQAP